MPDSAPRSLRWALYPIAVALFAAPVTASADEKAAPGNTGSKTAGSSSGNSITDGFRILGQKISDPTAQDRLQGHAQDFEKNVKDSREQQRKSHPGELRASDATDMANDPKMGGQGKTKSAAQSAPPKTAAKATSGAVPPPAKAPSKAPPPAAATSR